MIGETYKKVFFDKPSEEISVNDIPNHATLTGLVASGNIAIITYSETKHKWVAYNLYTCEIAFEFDLLSEFKGKVDKLIMQGNTYDIWGALREKHMGL